MGSKEISPPMMIGIIAAILIIACIIGWKVMKPPLADAGSKSNAAGTPPPEYQMHQQQFQSGGTQQTGNAPANFDPNARRRMMMGR